MIITLQKIVKLKRKVLARIMGFRLIEISDYTITIIRRCSEFFQREVHPHQRLTGLNLT